MRYGDKRPVMIRRCIFAAAIVTAAVFQNTPGWFPAPFGFHAFLLLPLLSAIAMFEREIPSAVFGAFAGALWDVCAGVDGIHALTLVVLATACSLMVSHFMRNNIISALVLGGSTVLCYEAVYILVFLVLGGAGGIIGVFFRFYLPSLVYTVLFIPVFYYPVRAVFTSYKEKV